jgi:ribosomal protein L22
MTPDNPQDPPKGKVDETTGKVAEEAAAAKATADAEAAAQPEPKPKRAKKSAPEAEGQAAAETGVDKAAAEATEEKPKRTPRAKKKDDEKPAEAKKETTGTRKRDRRPAAQPGVQVQARARYVRTSARKARLVCDHIRGKDVAEARAILAFTPRAAAKAWIKLLESAVANAEHNHELVGEDLRIAAVHADEGPTLKRYRPRAMGRATRIRKRTSHLTITLTPKES